MLKQTLFLNVSYYELALTIKYCQPTFFDRGAIHICLAKTLQHSAEEVLACVPSVHTLVLM